MRREWQSTNRRWWVVTLHFPSNQAMSTWVDAPAPEVGPPHLMFTDREEPGWHCAVPFPEYHRRTVASLLNEEKEAYWRQLVEAKPDFQPRGEA